jgi:hypothetical protein
MKKLVAWFKGLGADPGIVNLDHHNPRFEFWLAAPKDWRWHLKSGNGEIVAQGEGYITKTGVQRGIEAVRHAAAIADVFERAT